MIGSTIGNPVYDWLLYSVPQAGANNRIIDQPRGKGLGGSSLVRSSAPESDRLQLSIVDELLSIDPSLQGRI